MPTFLYGTPPRGRSCPPKNPIPGADKKADSNEPYAPGEYPPADPPIPHPVPYAPPPPRFTPPPPLNTGPTPPVPLPAPENTPPGPANIPVLGLVPVTETQFGEAFHSATV